MAKKKKVITITKRKRKPKLSNIRRVASNIFKKKS